MHKITLIENNIAGFPSVCGAAVIGMLATVSFVTPGKAQSLGDLGFLPGYLYSDVTGISGDGTILEQTP